MWYWDIYDICLSKNSFDRTIWPAPARKLFAARIQIARQQRSQIHLRCLFLLCLFWTHKLPENFPFGFSDVHNNTLGKILERQLTLILAQRAKDCCQSQLLIALRFQIFIFHHLCCLFNWRSIFELRKGIFCLKTHQNAIRITMTFDAIAGYLNVLLCPPFLPTPQT